MSTPLRLEVTAVASKSYSDRTHVSKALIVEFAVACGYNSSPIWHIGAMFRVQKSGPGLFGFHCIRQGNFWRPPNTLDRVRDKVIVITPSILDKQ